MGEFWDALFGVNELLSKKLPVLIGKIKAFNRNEFFDWNQKFRVPFQ